jgi:hypothetical protein
VDLFDKSAVNNLERLISQIKQNGCSVGIVLSSDWRIKGDVNHQKRLFGQHAFANLIIDKTICNPPL